MESSIKYCNARLYAALTEVKREKHLPSCFEGNSLSLLGVISNPERGRPLDVRDYELFKTHLQVKYVLLLTVSLDRLIGRNLSRLK